MMENEDHEVDFHSSLEPDVIIDDHSGDRYFSDNPLGPNHDYRNNIPDAAGPEISLIPVRRNSLKIKMYDKILCKDGSLDMQVPKVQRIIQRSPRQNVRLISHEEMVQAETECVHSKRKSLPLEKCPICKKFFRRMKTHLQKHENVNRDPNDPLTCRFCRKSFNTGSNLSIHMRTHTGDKPYICEICTKGFAQSCNLINHMRIHTGERPFKCPHCDRAFTQSGNLNNHVRLHTDEKPFKCHFCDKAFTQSGNLNSHIRNNHKVMTNGENELNQVQ